MCAYFKSALEMAGDVLDPHSRLANAEFRKQRILKSVKLALTAINKLFAL
jgi:hypothetical protein